ncbi:MAG: hypothetical protein V3T05_11995 [Myxococcota bacterium]
MATPKTSTRTGTRQIPNIEPGNDVGSREFEPVEVTPRTRKPELVEAYSELLERYRDLEKQAPPSKVRAEAKRRQQVVEGAQEWTVERVISSTGDLKLGVNTALDNIALQLTSQSERLAQIDLAIEVQTSRLAELHDIDVAADSLAVLLAQHEQSEQEHAERLQARQDEARETFDTAKADVLAQINSAKEAFAAETERTRLGWEEEQRLHDRDQTRTREEHEYEAKLQRLREARAFEEEKAGREKELSEREQRVATQEHDLARLNAELDAVPGRIEKAVAEAKKAARAEATREAEITAQLLEREGATRDQVATLKIANFEAKVAEQATRIAELTRQAELASNKVETIATKAIEGAASRTSYISAGELAAKQARETPKN